MAGKLRNRSNRSSSTPGTRREKRGGLDLSRLLPFEPKPRRKSNRESSSGSHGTYSLYQAATRLTKFAAPRRSTHNMDHQPPILVRRGLQDMATPLRRSKVPRKRFDLTLSVPGAEVRLPSMPRVGLGWRFASALLVAWMLLAAYALVFSASFKVEMLTVEGMQRLTLDDLDLALGITGEPVVSLNPQEIRQQLLDSFPDLSAVQVSIGLPATVMLEVTERQPVVAWGRQGETVWVDADGVVFPKRGDTPQGVLRVEADSLPLVSSASLTPEAGSTSEAAERIDKQQVNVLLEMSKYMPAGAIMAFDAQHGFGWADGRGWSVYFGTRLDDIDQKLLVYQAIVDRLQNDGVTPALISVEFLHAPYYRMER